MAGSLGSFSAAAGGGVAPLSLASVKALDRGSVGSTRSIKRHSLVVAPLRPARCATDGPAQAARGVTAEGTRGERAHSEKVAPSWLQPGVERTVGAVFTDEVDMQGQADADVLQSMRQQICRFKPQLTAAFVRAEKALVEAGELHRRTSGARASGRGRSHTLVGDHGSLPRDQWLGVLQQALPEHGPLWAAYSQRLLDGSEGDFSNKHEAVHFMRWLDRFQAPSH